MVYRLIPVKRMQKQIQTVKMADNRTDKRMNFLLNLSFFFVFLSGTRNNRSFVVESKVRLGTNSLTWELTEICLTRYDQDVSQ